jgi:hypothetical protein
MADPLDDPLVAAFIEKAIAPYRSTLGAAELQVLRDVLAIQLASHPVLSQYVARLAPRADVHESAEVETGAAPGAAVEQPPTPKRAKKAQGG